LSLVLLTLSLPSAPVKADALPPNIVVLMIDDLDYNLLSAAVANGLMPNFTSVLQVQGTTFTNSYVSYSLCCPSRATFLTGEYAHNHGVLNNALDIGGCESFHDGTLNYGTTSQDGTTLPIWLSTSSNNPYYTGLIGKYLNGYGSGNHPETYPCEDEAYVPKGWSEWHGIDGETSHEKDFWLNDTVNGNTTYHHAQVC